MAEQDRPDFTLYADEFQNFATTSFAEILSEARKYRLALVLAHQFLGQLPDLLRQAVIGNAGTIVAFRVGAEDAALLAAELAIETPRALCDTRNFLAWIKLMQGGLPSDTMPITTLPPLPTASHRLEAVRSRTRARFARPRATVEAKIARFFRQP